MHGSLFQIFVTCVLPKILTSWTESILFMPYISKNKKESDTVSIMIYMLTSTNDCRTSY